MRFQLLGRSGMRVSELCLGTMTFGDDWGWGADKDSAQQMFTAFADAGGNFIDTSCNYTNGTSERFVGDFIHSERDQFVVATKYTLMSPDSTQPNLGGNSRKNMMRSVEGSLKRLQTDVIDVLYLHVWDYLTPIEEVLQGLHDLVAQGKVLYIAISDTPSWVVSMANMMAELRGWPRFIGLQVPYSLLERDIEAELLPMARHWDMAVMPWGLLKAGVLSGKFLQKVDQPTRVNADQLKLSDKEIKVVQTVVDIATEVGQSPSQVAINWVRQQTHRAQIIPILGVRTPQQLQDNLACLEWRLSDEQITRLSEVSALPSSFLTRFASSPYVFGKTKDLIDDHRRGTPPASF